MTELFDVPVIPYIRSGQSFLLAGQILKIIFIAGRKFFTFELSFHILSFLMPFGLWYECSYKFLIVKKVGGAANKSWRAASGPRAALWPCLRAYIIGFSMSPFFLFDVTVSRYLIFFFFTMLLLVATLSDTFLTW